MCTWRVSIHWPILISEFNQFYPFVWTTTNESESDWKIFPLIKHFHWINEFWMNSSDKNRPQKQTQNHASSNNISSHPIYSNWFCKHHDYNLQCVIWHLYNKHNLKSNIYVNVNAINLHRMNVRALKYVINSHRVCMCVSGKYQQHDWLHKASYVIKYYRFIFSVAERYFAYASKCVGRLNRMWIIRHTESLFIIKNCYH